MDFTFSAEQDALRAAVRGFLADPTGNGIPRTVPDEGGAALWREISALGWPALLVPEDRSGLGLGWVDAVVVLEEMGRATLPAPYLSSAILATDAALRLGADDLLGGLVDGGQRGTIALDEAGHGDPVARLRTRAQRKGATWQLRGLKPVVLDGAGADWVIVAARTAEGVGSFVVDGAACEPVPALDPTRAVARLALVDTAAEPIGPPGDHSAIWRGIADDGAVALAAELVGVCDGAIAMAVEHAQVRVQFDRPLASHQVIQHKLVDMLHRLELGRVGVHYAAWAADVDDGERSRAAAIAKSSMAEAAIFVTNENIQVHGAVGFTWDSDAHLYAKRAKQNDLLLGAQAWHRSRVADGLLDVL